MASDPDIGAQVPELLNGGAWLAIIAAVLGFIRWAIGASGANQSARIANLEAMLGERQAAREAINNKLMALAHALSEVMAALEQHDNCHAALGRARKALADVFPVEGNHHND
jgi:hypothetical protein